MKHAILEFSSAFYVHYVLYFRPNIFTRCPAFRPSLLERRKRKVSRKLKNNGKNLDEN